MPLLEMLVFSLHNVPLPEARGMCLQVRMQHLFGVLLLLIIVLFFRVLRLWSTIRDLQNTAWMFVGGSLPFHLPTCDLSVDSFVGLQNIVEPYPISRFNSVAIDVPVNANDALTIVPHLSSSAELSQYTS